MDFVGFPSIPRLRREMVITEKIDGTNAQILVHDPKESTPQLQTWTPPLCEVGGMLVWAGSRTQWITPERDNHGFASWVKDNAEALALGLGPGRHYGEWWGQGIQRKYGMKKKVFSLFNIWRWINDGGPDNMDPNREFLAEKEQEKLRQVPPGCDVVPILHRGAFGVGKAEVVMSSLYYSKASGRQGVVYHNPEGVVVFHKAGKHLYKMTFENDEGGKDQ